MLRLRQLKNKKFELSVLKELNKNGELDLCRKTCCAFHSHLNTDRNIGSEGAIVVAEVLKSNTTLKVLLLTCNKLIASFHSHSIQGITLVMKEQSALKSNASVTFLHLYGNRLVASFDSHSIQAIRLEMKEQSN
jgi:hypothetical protein